MTEITFPGGTTAFLGAGPRTEKPVLVTSFRDFEQTFGLQLPGFLSIAVRGFFENGGRRAYVTISPSANPIADGLQALEAMTDDRCSLVCCPDESQLPGAADPWLIVANVTGQGDVTVPPCGHVAGAYGETILNARGVNTVRRVPAQGIVIWGARTTSNDQEWHYVNVRRLFAFIQESIAHGTRWVVFEPNSPILWIDMRLTLEMFLRTLWKNGALVGSTPPDAFFVRCDRTTMTQEDLDAGRLVALVGVALLRRAEFVIIRITAHTRSYTS